MKYSVYVGEEKLTDYVIIPLSEQLALDESLDQGYLQLKFTNKQNAFKPFTDVRIVINDEFSHERELNFFIASDQKTEIIANGTFSHDLLLIEQSKWFERFLTGTKTVTNPLVHDYVGTAGDVYVTQTSDWGTPLDGNYYSNLYDSVINLNETATLQCVSCKNFFNFTPESTFTIMTNECYLKIIGNNSTNTYGYTDAPLINLAEGVYSFEYKFVIQGDTAFSTFVTMANFRIFVISQAEPKPNKTITDAVNSLLATIETLRADETPRFAFNSEQATKYSEIDSPEFTLTGTLWEALRQIGTYIHAIPRLRGNQVYFDELGGDEKVATKLTDYVSNTEKFDIEQFASAIDSTVQNMVNLDDQNEGSIVEPYKFGFKTPRTETGVVRVVDNNMFIQTKEPIEKIVKVEVGYLKDNSLVGDITPYVYEQAEYDALSSYEDNYPYAKAYAIKYTVGKNNITELNFKRENATSPVFENFAIKNIISRVTGKDISVIDQIFGDNIGDMSKLQFRVTYVPITTTRVRQVKPYTWDLEFDSTLAYNQSAQKVSSRAYGEAMKGAVARLGNPQITKVFILNDLSLIPNAGELYDDDYYVSVVKCEYYRDFVKCSVGLSKDFNRLNEYVGINSEQRFYEISEKQATDRYVLYEEYCLIATTPQTASNMPTSNFSLLSSFGVDNFKKLYQQESIEIVDAIGGNENGVYGAEVILPVTSYGIGNSSIFTFRYDDNYSAGERSFFEGGSYLQNQVQYTDVYGEVEYLELQFMTTTGTYTDTYAEAWEEGNTLPLYDYTKVQFQSDFLAGTNFAPILLKKDNREKIVFTYEIHYVANDSSIVIGSLSYRNGLVGKNTEVGTDLISNFYALDYEIPKYAKSIDLTHAVNINANDLQLSDIRKNITPTASQKIGFVISVKANVGLNCKAIALALPNGELIVGRNITLNGQTPARDILSFEFVRKVN